jgi:hypothetical protein
MSSYEILGLGAGKGLVWRKVCNKSNRVGAGENAISIIGQKGLQVELVHLQRGATDLAKFAGNSLSNARQPLSMMYNNDNSRL